MPIFINIFHHYLSKIMIYGIFRLMNNWQVNNSSCLWKRNHQRSGKRNKRSRKRKPQKTKEKEMLHLFPQRLYSKALYTQSSSFYYWWTSGQMAPLGISNREIQGSNPFSTTSNVLKNCHHFIDILRLTLYLIFYPNDFLSILIWQISGTKKDGYKIWGW